MNRIPPRNQSVGFDEFVNLHRVAQNEIYTHGVFSKEFEKRMADFVGAKFALLCNSGSSANLLAMSALTAVELGDRRLKQGDEVITTALNFPTTVNPIIQCGLTPVFIDIKLPYYVGKDEGYRAKAGIATDFLGNLSRMSDTDLLIRDCCDSLGSRTGCNLAETSTYSFYPAHTITTGEGGAVCTDDPLLYKLMRSFRDWGGTASARAGRTINAGIASMANMTISTPIPISATTCK